jgi:hypothetical protein
MDQYFIPDLVTLTLTYFAEGPVAQDSMQHLAWELGINAWTVLDFISVVQNTISGFFLGYSVSDWRTDFVMVDTGKLLVSRNGPAGIDVDDLLHVIIQWQVDRAQNCHIKIIGTPSCEYPKVISALKKGLLNENVRYDGLSIRFFLRSKHQSARCHDPSGGIRTLGLFEAMREGEWTDDVTNIYLSDAGGECALFESLVKPHWHEAQLSALYEYETKSRNLY